LACAIAAAQSVVQGSLQFENRFEGTTVHQNDLEDFTILAIHRSFEEFPQNSRLNVRFFIPTLDLSTTRTVFVQAAELQDTSKHYFMHSKPITNLAVNAYNVFAPWPTTDVIDKLKIRPKNIGVLAGWQSAGDITVYTPVDVFQAEHHPSNGPYIFWFVVGQTCNLNMDPDCALYPAASTQALPIEFSSLPAGKYDVRFVGHIPKSSRTFAFDVRVYHPSSSTGTR
jgi:hypothetical protein